MNLTGKCKQAFENWFFEKFGKTPYQGHAQNSYWGRFSALPWIMQYGVYVSFFDEMNMQASAYKKVHCDVVYYESCNDGYLGAWSSLYQASDESIKKANNDYNYKLKTIRDGL